MALLLFGPARRKSAEATGTRARVRETSAREDGRALDGSRERARTVACSIRACASAGSGPRPRPWSPLRIFHVTRPRQQKQTAPRLGVVASPCRVSAWSVIRVSASAGQNAAGQRQSTARRSTSPSLDQPCRAKVNIRFLTDTPGGQKNLPCAFSSESGTAGVATPARAEPRARRARERGVARISRRSTREGIATTDASVSTRAREPWWTSGARREFLIPPRWRAGKTRASKQLPASFGGGAAREARTPEARCPSLPALCST